MFMAMDPSVFVEDFPSRLSGLMSDMRNLEPVSSHIIPCHIPTSEPFPCRHQANTLSLETLVSLNLDQFDEFRRL